MMVPLDHDHVKNPIVHCKFCGNDERCIWNEETNAKLVKNSTCFTCDCWEERAQHLASSAGKQFPIAVVVHSRPSPRVYTIAKEMPQFRGLMRGYGGSRFIIDFDDGRKMASSNLWSGAQVPLLWARDPRFQPTACLRSQPFPESGFLREFLDLINNGAFLSEEEQE